MFFAPDETLRAANNIADWQERIGRFLHHRAAAVLFACALIACGGNSPGGRNGEGGPDGGTGYTVGGMVSGLLGSGLVLQNNAGDDLAISGNGPFRFPTAMAGSDAFNIRVLAQPTRPSQTCTIANASGTINGADVTNVMVTCSTNTFTVGGTVSDLTGSGLVLRNERGDELHLDAGKTSFTFSRPVASGGMYNVTVLAQPSGQICSVTHGSGMVGSANVTDVAITCLIALDAEPGKGVVTLTWPDSGAIHYDLFLSTAPNCEIDHYTSCPNGSLHANVISPHVVIGLVNGRPYYFRLRAQYAGHVSVSNEAGARPDILTANGAVHAIASSTTEVFLGGDFTQIGVRSGGGLALDKYVGRASSPTFPIVNGKVFAVAQDGTGGWYIGGEFTAVGAVARSNLAHVRVDGSVDPNWNLGANSNVWALAVSGSTVYVGGNFTAIGGQARNYLAALNASGALLGWNPGANQWVKALAVSGSTVYVGGNFTSIGGQARNRLAALDASGTLLSWNPNADELVYTLAVSGDVVYVGGAFTTIGIQFRNGIAALNATSGAAMSWDPNARVAGGSGRVEALAVSDDTVYAGGYFTSIGGQARNYLAALTASSGTALSWNPDGNGPVTALAVSDGVVYAGGWFTLVGGQYRNHVAAFDASGAPLSWNPNADNVVYALATSGTAVYAGGVFTSIGGQARSHIAALDSPSGALLDWHQNVNDSVYALAVSGTTVYLGGDFTTVGRIAGNRPHIAALDASTGAVQSWNPIANGAVRALAASGGVVYAGGFFTTIGGQARGYIAALNASGAALSFPQGADGAVYALAASGDTVYAGGHFTQVLTSVWRDRNSIAAFDAPTGNLTNWNPDAGGGYVNALAVSGGTVFAGGEFTGIGGEARNNIAALNASSGHLLDWNPNAVGGYVAALAVSDSTVYVGGYFTFIGGRARNNIAALDVTSSTALSWNPNANSYVYALALSGNTLYAGGLFTSIGNQLVRGFATP